MPSLNVFSFLDWSKERNWRELTQYSSKKMTVWWRIKFYWLVEALHDLSLADNNWHFEDELRLSNSLKQNVYNRSTNPKLLLTEMLICLLKVFNGSVTSLFSREINIVGTLIEAAWSGGVTEARRGSCPHPNTIRGWKWHRLSLQEHYLNSSKLNEAKFLCRCKLDSESLMI